jgi:hypothetical protein
MKTIHHFMAVLCCGLFLTSCTEQAPATTEAPPAAEATLSEADLVKRGEYLIHTMGCNDCHTPKLMTPKGPVPDDKRLLSGYPAGEKLAPIADPKILKDYALFNGSLTAAVGPWGTTFAANLTPDETGLGNWTLEQFGKALKEGKSKGMDGARPLLPPMPWQNYVNISDEDLAALFAYLKSIPPVKNVVPAPLPPAAG